MTAPARDVDVIVVGAGFAGLYMLHRLRDAGFTVRVIEKGDDVGGTWYWNRYPGARCDVESLQYSYSFSAALEEEWDWTERYATQPEILRYAQHVATRFDLRPDIVFGTCVAAASWDEAASRWIIQTDTAGRLQARFVVLATGCLSRSRRPDIPGLDRFGGRVLHTGDWPHEPVSFAGRRVGLIGTGSSAIQAVPVIATEAAHLTVFQRTPNFSVPANNRPLQEAERRAWRSNRAELRRRAREDSRNGLLLPHSGQGALKVSVADRQQRYESGWSEGGITFMASFDDLLLDEQANTTAADFVRDKIRAIVDAPDTAAALQPRDYPIGAKRLCVDTGYYATFNRPNVTLVDLRNTPLDEVTPEGIVCGGQLVALDDIVCATGFDAMTGAILAIDPAGREGVRLKEKWAAGPVTYLGLMTSGFPNLFMVTGPGSPSVLSNMLVSIEQHVDWIADCLCALRSSADTTIEPEPEAERRWIDHVNAVASRTLYPRAASWYMGANVPGKPRVFMPYVGGVGMYRKICADIAREGYSGFRRTHAAKA